MSFHPDIKKETTEKCTNLSDASESSQSSWHLPPQLETIQRDLEKLTTLLNPIKRRGDEVTSLAAQLLRVDDNDEHSILSLSFPLGHQSGKGRCLVRNNNAQLKNRLFLAPKDHDYSSSSFECVKQGGNSNTMPTAKYIRIQADCVTGEPMISIFDECGQSQVASAYLAKDFKLDIDFKLWACNGNIVPSGSNANTRRSSNACACCNSQPMKTSATLTAKNGFSSTCNPGTPCSPQFQQQCLTACPPSCTQQCPTTCQSSCPPPPVTQPSYNPPCPVSCPQSCPQACPPSANSYPSVDQNACGNWHIWRIGNFAQLEECNGGEWCEPFYLGQPGYRMQAKLEFTTYLFGIYIKLVPGDYDDCLSWPFSSDIYFSILDQTGAGNHIVRVLRPYLNDEDEREVWQRPTRSSSNQVGWGLPDIGLRSLVHSRICKPSPYLRNGTLYIQITLGKATCTQEAL